MLARRVSSGRLPKDNKVYGQRRILFSQAGTSVFAFFVAICSALVFTCVVIIQHDEVCGG